MVLDWGQLPKGMVHPQKLIKAPSEVIPAPPGLTENINNTAWLIAHGFGLLNEYTERYGKNTYM